MNSGMKIKIGTRDQLLVDLEASLAPGEPVRLLVILRLGGFEEFVSKFGNGATDKLLNVVVSRLPPASGPSHFYYRPRKDELCGLIAGRLDGVEASLFAAAREINETLGEDGISLGFGTAVLPHQAHDAVEALALADSRVVGVADGDPMPRSSGSGSLPLGLFV
jgi:GGDEF domain-containing protein